MPFLKSRSKVFLGVNLSVAAISLLAGCSTKSAASQSGAASEQTGSSVTLPKGTRLTVRTTSALSTQTYEPGETFSAMLAQPLLRNGHEIAARGARVEGLIVHPAEGRLARNFPSLTVRLIGLHTDGRVIAISTNTLTHDARPSQDPVDSETPAGTGGTVMGSPGGEGHGTGVVLIARGDPAVIPSDTLLSFELRDPVTIAER